VKGNPQREPAGATLDFFARRVEITSGLEELRSHVDDNTEIECLLVRAQEMSALRRVWRVDPGDYRPRMVVVETSAKVDELSELVYAKQRLAAFAGLLAVPEMSDRSRNTWRERYRQRVVHITESYLAKHEVKRA